jgi:sRNA-binding protein
MSNSSIFAKLCERFPVFEPQQDEPHRPLALKIREQIWDRWPDVDRDGLSVTLRWYTQRRMYLLSVIAGGNRYSLDGNAVGEITPSEIEYATGVLASIDAKKLKAAEEAAAKYQRQREERERTAVRHVKAKPQRKPAKPPASAFSSQQRPPVRHLSRGELAALAKARRIGG